MLALRALTVCAALLVACSGTDGPRIGGSEDPSTPAPDDEANPARVRASEVVDGKQFQAPAPAPAPKPTCDDCRTSKCRAEFDACTADATCPFLRTCLDGCDDSACRSKCFVTWPDPIAKAKNGALYKCQLSECSAECG